MYQNTHVLNNSLKFIAFFQMDNQLQKQVEVSYRNVSLLKNALLLLLTIFVLPGELGTSLFYTNVRLQQIPDVVTGCHSLYPNQTFSQPAIQLKKLPTNTISYISLT